MNLATLANIPLTAKIGAGAIAGLALLGGAAAAGAHFGVASTPTSANEPVVASPAPGPSAGAAARNGAAQAVGRAERQAEAQVLGIPLKQLNADFKARQTVQQLATQKGMSQAQFASQLQQTVKPLLDQEVTAGTLTSAQEQRAIQRLGTTIPNWSQVGAARKASPTPTP